MIIEKSTNGWTKNRDAGSILSKSSNGFSSLSFSTGSESFTRNSSSEFISKSIANGWNGDNLTSDPFGFDDLFSGTAYGSGEYGGIKHFESSKDST